jgi:hypothetical protein
VKTVGAIVAAVAMVVVAVVIRAEIDDRRNTDGDAHLVCATELEEACTGLDDAVGGLDVTVEPAGVTAVRLSTLPDTDVDDPGLDGWLVPGPWPQIVDIVRAQDQLRPVFEESTTTIARSPLVIFVRKDRARVLEEGPCAGAVAWRCLGDAAGQAWDDLGGDFPGEVKVTHTNPTTSAAGLLVLAQATSQFLGNTTYSRADLETDEFRAWLARLEGSGTSPSPFQEMLSAFPTAVYDATGATEAEAGPALADAAADRRDAFTLLYPEPVATADVVLALTTSDERDDDIADLAAGGRARQELAESGWRVEGHDLAKGLRKRLQLPDGTNLPPDAGVYIALQNSWQQVTG